MGKKCYFSLVQLFKFKTKHSSRKTRIRLFKIFVWSIVLYAWGEWASTKSDENKLIIFEWKIYFGPKKSDYEIRSNKEFITLFNDPIIGQQCHTQKSHIKEGQICLESLGPIYTDNNKMET